MKNINYEQIQRIAKIDHLFEPVRQAFIDYNSPKLIGIPINLLHFPQNADAHIKIAAIAGYPYFSVKVATMFPQNAQHRLSPHNGAIFLFSTQTGIPEYILNDRGLLTDLRTAAAGALITDYVANKEADTVAVIGTGIQAFQQINALTKLRDIQRISIYGRNQDKALELKKKLETICPNPNISLVSEVETAVKSSEIILTTTSSKEPLVLGKWLQNGQHITAIGADDTYKQELDIACFKRANTIFLDSLELNQNCGEYRHAQKSIPNLLEKTVEFGIAFSDHFYSNRENEITIAKLVGLGVQDLAVAITVIKALNPKSM